MQMVLDDSMFLPSQNCRVIEISTHKILTWQFLYFCLEARLRSEGKSPGWLLLWVNINVDSDTMCNNAETSRYMPRIMEDVIVVIFFKIHLNNLMWYSANTERLIF